LRYRDRPATGRGFRISFDQLAADLGDGAPNANSPCSQIDIFDTEADQLAKSQTSEGQERDDVALDAADAGQPGDLLSR
jgi:hypothetical protein